MHRRFLPLFLIAPLTMVVGCGGSSTGSAQAAAGPPAADADSYQSYGMTVKRPEGWRWIPADSSVTPDTLVVLQGPVGQEELAPAIEIGRRELDARTQRRPPSAILTQLTMELVQTLDAFEMIGTPADIQLAGKPAAEVRMKYTDTLADGQTVHREGRFYGVVNGANLFLFRCLGAPGGANDAEFDAVLNTVSFGG